MRPCFGALSALLFLLLSATVLAIGPSLQLTLPVDGYNSPGNSLNLGALYSAGDSIYDIADCDLNIDSVRDATYLFNSNIGQTFGPSDLSTGMHTWWVVCTPRNSQTSQTGTPITSETRTFTVPGTPIVTMTSPLDGETVVGPHLTTILARSNDWPVIYSPNLVICDVRLDGAVVAQIQINAGDSYTYTSGGEQPNGLHTLQVMCFNIPPGNPNGVMAYFSQTIKTTYTMINGTGNGNGGNSDPTIVLVSPSPGYSSPDHTVPFVFRYERGNSQEVTLSCLIRVTDTDSGQTQSYGPVTAVSTEETHYWKTLAGGSYSWDVACGPLVSGSQLFDIDVVPPTITIASPPSPYTSPDGSALFKFTYTSGERGPSLGDCALVIGPFVEASSQALSGHEQIMQRDHLSVGTRLWHIQCNVNTPYFVQSPPRTLTVNPTQPDCGAPGIVSYGESLENGGYNVWLNDITVQSYDAVLTLTGPDGVSIGPVSVPVGSTYTFHDEVHQKAISVHVAHTALGASLTAIWADLTLYPACAWGSSFDPISCVCVSNPSGACGQAGDLGICAQACPDQVQTCIYDGAGACTCACASETPALLIEQHGADSSILINGYTIRLDDIGISSTQFAAELSILDANDQPVAAPQIAPGTRYYFTDPTTGTSFSIYVVSTTAGATLTTNSASLRISPLCQAGDYYSSGTCACEPNTATYCGDGTDHDVCAAACLLQDGSIDPSRECTLITYAPWDPNHPLKPLSCGCDCKADIDTTISIGELIDTGLLKIRLADLSIPGENGRQGAIFDILDANDAVVATRTVLDGHFAAVVDPFSGQTLTFLLVQSSAGITLNTKHAQVRVYPICGAGQVFDPASCVCVNSPDFCTTEPSWFMPLTCSAQCPSQNKECVLVSSGTQEGDSCACDCTPAAAQTISIGETIPAGPYLVRLADIEQNSNAALLDLLDGAGNVLDIQRAPLGYYQFGQFDYGYGRVVLRDHATGKTVAVRVLGTHVGITLSAKIADLRVFDVCDAGQYYDPESCQCQPDLASACGVEEDALVCAVPCADAAKECLPSQWACFCACQSPEAKTISVGEIAAMGDYTVSLTDLQINTHAAIFNLTGPDGSILGRAIVPPDSTFTFLDPTNGQTLLIAVMDTGAGITLNAKWAQVRLYPVCDAGFVYDLQTCACVENTASSCGASTDAGVCSKSCSNSLDCILAAGNQCACDCPANADQILNRGESMAVGTYHLKLTDVTVSGNLVIDFINQNNQLVDSVSMPPGYTYTFTDASNDVRLTFAAVRGGVGTMLSANWGELRAYPFCTLNQTYDLAACQCLNPPAQSVTPQTPQPWHPGYSPTGGWEIPLSFYSRSGGAANSKFAPAFGGAADEPVVLDAPISARVGDQLLLNLTRGGRPLPNATIRVMLGGVEQAAPRTETMGRAFYIPNAPGLYSYLVVGYNIANVTTNVSLRLAPSQPLPAQPKVEPAAAAPPAPAMGWLPFALALLFLLLAIFAAYYFLSKKGKEAEESAAGSSIISPNTPSASTSLSQTPSVSSIYSSTITDAKEPASSPALANSSAKPALAEQLSPSIRSTTSPGSSAIEAPLSTSSSKTTGPIPFTDAAPARPSAAPKEAPAKSTASRPPPAPRKSAARPPKAEAKPKSAAYFMNGRRRPTLPM